MQKVTKVAESDYEIIRKDTTNLWDQLIELMKIQRWTTQDYATTNLLREMDSVVTLFLVRKADNFLLGATVLIETPDLVYGNVYVMREGYRASGMGMRLVATFQGILGESFAKKPFIARGAEAMMGKYAGPPFYCAHLYELYSFEFKSRKEVCDFFPLTKENKNRVRAVKDLTPRQFQEFVNYDKLVTGVDRTKFIQDYYSFSFVEGLIMYDERDKIIGMIGAVPTFGGDHLFKVNPIFAQNQEDASFLIQAITARVNDPEAEFVFHVRTQSAGDWILKKCHDENIKLHRVGVLCNAMNLNQPYVDPSKQQLIFAPNNSPAHFDG